MRPSRGRRQRSAGLLRQLPWPPAGNDRYATSPGRSRSAISLDDVLTGVVAEAGQALGADVAVVRLREKTAGATWARPGATAGAMDVRERSSARDDGRRHRGRRRPLERPAGLGCCPAPARRGTGGPPVGSRQSGRPPRAVDGRTYALASARPGLAGHPRAGHRRGHRAQRSSMTGLTMSSRCKSSTGPPRRALRGPDPDCRASLSAPDFRVSGHVLGHVPAQLHAGLGRIKI